MLSGWFFTKPSSTRELIPQVGTSGKVFYVREGNPTDAKVRADLLDDMTNRALALISYLKEHQPNKCYTPLLVARFPLAPLTEADPNSELTAYTTNKTSISLCLRKLKGVDTSDLVDNNTLAYVLVHELAHLGINHVGHGTEFWDAFKELAGFARELKLIDYVNYNSNKVKYCTMDITSSIFDTQSNGTSFNN